MEDGSDNVDVEPDDDDDEADNDDVASFCEATKLPAATATPPAPMYGWNSGKIC